MKPGDSIEVLQQSFQGLAARETSALAIIESIDEKKIVARFVRRRDDGVELIALEVSAQNRTWR
jgi:hypothetical protein